MKTGSSTRMPDHSGFSRPLEVVRAEGIQDEDKLRLLLDWLEDEVALLVADDEGMFGGAPPRVHEVLEAIHEVLGASETRR